MGNTYDRMLAMMIILFKSEGCGPLKCERVNVVKTSVREKLNYNICQSSEPRNPKLLPQCVQFAGRDGKKSITSLVITGNDIGAAGLIYMDVYVILYRYKYMIIAHLCK